MLSWETVPELIEEDTRSDEVFPLRSNCRDLSIKEILEAYKRKHPLIEKRHEMLKSVLETTPLFLKNIGLVEAFLFMEYSALTVHGLIERELWQAMEREGIKKISLYPEDCEDRTRRRHGSSRSSGTCNATFSAKKEGSGSRHSCRRYRSYRKRY